MAEFVFTSPGVKFRERDLTFVTRNIGITTLGLVGETLKGPAFEPVFVQDKTQFAQRFGAQSTKRFSSGLLQYQLPYVANAYLEESNQLYVTRVLGLSGYDAGTAWNVVLEAGVDPNTVKFVSSGTTLEPFTDGEYFDVSLGHTGQTGVAFLGFHKVSDTLFTGTSHIFTVVSYTPATRSGVVSDIQSIFTGSSYTQYEDMVLAVIRSRGYVKDNVNAIPTTIFDTYQDPTDDGLIIVPSANTTIEGLTGFYGDMFGTFKLTATNRGLKVPPPTSPSEDPYSGSTESYIVSLNPNSTSFIPYVVGSEPKDKNTKIWVQAVYPDLIKWLDSAGDTYPTGLTKYGIGGTAPYGYGVKSELLHSETDVFIDYKTQFKTPETPWVVSQIKGSSVDRLFKFISISDGDAANQEIKISITNIKPDTLEFDVVIRDFNDTDDNPVILEQFSRCNLTVGTTGYIAQRIGTSDGEYDLQSRYVMIELADSIEPGVFPAGFEGYMFNRYDTIVTEGNFDAVAPEIRYKTKYDDDERPRKVYLGISEKAYSTGSVAGTGINQNFFNFNNSNASFNSTGFTKTKGFHMDVDASVVTSFGYSFESGDGKFQTIEDIVEPDSPYYELISRKFTLVPAGGFDGWNVHRTERSYGDNFSLNKIYDGVVPNGNPTNDFQAWQTAINTFANPEEITINLFATPGINWSAQNILVQDTIDMIEEQRTDSLYVIDAPDSSIQQIIGEPKVDVIAAQDIADLLDAAEIDSNYACTYFPWIQMRDTQNNVNVYLPPTGEVVKAMAFTDNTKFPWFAPAGLTRGVTDARKSKYKLSQEACDVLYENRINPLKDFADAGTAIFGQKTLQVKESALDRVNVRRLLLQIKVLIANIAIRLVFEQNDQTTIDQFLQKATPILDNIKRERGLYEFRIKMDDSNNTPESRDRNELYGEIFLKPTRAVEFIGITFTITPTGASFADVGA